MPGIVHGLGNSMHAIHEREPHFVGTLPFSRPAAAPAHTLCQALLQARIVHKPNPADFFGSTARQHQSAHTHAALRRRASPQPRQRVSSEPPALMGLMGLENYSLDGIVLATF